MVFRSTKCDCWGRQAGLLSGTPYMKAMLPSHSSDIRNWVPIRDRSGRRAWEESSQPPKCQLRADFASLASTLITDGANLHSTSLLPLRTHWKFKLYIFRAHKDFFFFFLHWALSLFPKELKEQFPSLPRIKGHPEESRGAGGRAGQKNNAGGTDISFRLQQCAKKRAILRSKMVLGSHGRRAMAELLLFLGRGPLQRGVLQQLMHTEFSFPGEQKDWYPAEAMRQAADDAHDLRYMIPATQTQRSEVSLPVPAKGLQPP